MTADPTVHPTLAPAPKADHDLAPVSSVTKALAVADDLVPVSAKTENVIRLEKTPRAKTWGEKAFDWATYVGFGLVANEAASLAIMKQVAKAKPEKGIQEGRFYKQFLEFENVFTHMKLDKVFAKEFIEKRLNYITKGRIAELLVATIGGMLMVFPIKYLEDHKGSIVRKWDQWRHGEKADTDPHMVEAHKEMDEAPRQSWSSLWKGRAITVASAIAADAIFGWKDSITGKTFSWKDPSTKETVGLSLQHAGQAVSKNVLKLFKTDEHRSPKAAFALDEGTWLLTLSASLTALFYVTSKMFAKESAIHKEKKLAQREQMANAGMAYGDTGQNNEIASTPPPSTKPDLKISHAAYERPLELRQQPSMNFN